MSYTRQQIHDALDLLEEARGALALDWSVDIDKRSLRLSLAAPSLTAAIYVHGSDPGLWVVAVDGTILGSRRTVAEAVGLFAQMLNDRVHELHRHLLPVARAIEAAPVWDEVDADEEVSER